MTIVQLVDRITGLSTDAKPTTGIPNHRIFEETDTGKWFEFEQGTTTWVLMGQTAVATHANTSTTTSPNFEPLGITGNNPFIVFSSNVALPAATGFPVIPLGTKALESDTGNWYRWNGASWVPTAAGSATAGSTGDKGGGSAVFSGNGVLTAFNIPHGLGVIPSVFGVAAGSTAANILHFVTADATNLTVTFASAPASAANNVTIRWWAKP